MRMAQETGEQVQAKDGGDHHFAEWFARGMIRTAQETGEPASDTSKSEAKSTITVIVKCKPVTAGPTRALAEQPMRMAQKFPSFTIRPQRGGSQDHEEPTGHPAALGRSTAAPYLLPASNFHSRTPPLPRTALPFIHPPLSREPPGLTK